MRLPEPNRWVSLYNVLRFISFEVLFRKKCECGDKMEDMNMLSYPPRASFMPEWKCRNKNHDKDLRDKKLKKLLR